MKSSNLPVLPFASKKKWADWLARQYDKSSGVWLKLAKKGSGTPSVTYDEAVEVALCYGWIDGQKKGFDEKYWLQKFTPRGARSIWSKINTGRVEKLIKNGEMKPPGLRAVETAKQDGRWDAPNVHVVVREKNVEGLEKEIGRGVTKGVTDTFTRFETLVGSWA